MHADNYREPTHGVSLPGAVPWDGWGLSCSPCLHHQALLSTGNGNLAGQHTMVRELPSPKSAAQHELNFLQRYACVVSVTLLHGQAQLLANSMYGLQEIACMIAV